MFDSLLDLDLFLLASKADNKQWSQFSKLIFLHEWISSAKLANTTNHIVRFLILIDAT